MNPTKEPWNDDRIRKAAIVRHQPPGVHRPRLQGRGEGERPRPLAAGRLALPADELKTATSRTTRKKAKELIKAATGNDTIDVTIMYPADSTIEQHNLHLPIFLEQMKRRGLQRRSKDPQAFATWLDNYTNLNYDASLALNQVYEYAEFNMDFQHSEGPARNKIYADRRRQARTRRSTRRSTDVKTHHRSEAFRRRRCSDLQQR